MSDDDPERLEPLHEQAEAVLTDGPETDADEFDRWLDGDGTFTEDDRGGWHPVILPPWHGFKPAESRLRTEALVRQAQREMAARELPAYAISYSGGLHCTCPRSKPCPHMAYAVRGRWPLDLAPAEAARADETARFLAAHPPIPLEAPLALVTGHESDAGRFYPLDEFTQRLLAFDARQPRLVCSNTLYALAGQSWFEHWIGRPVRRLCLNVLPAAFRALSGRR